MMVALGNISYELREHFECLQYNSFFLATFYFHSIYKHIYLLQFQTLSLKDSLKCKEILISVNTTRVCCAFSKAFLKTFLTLFSRTNSRGRSGHSSRSIPVVLPVNIIKNHLSMSGRISGRLLQRVFSPETSREEVSGVKKPPEGLPVFFTNQ